MNDIIYIPDKYCFIQIQENFIWKIHIEINIFILL